MSNSIIFYIDISKSLEELKILRDKKFTEEKISEYSEDDQKFIREILFNDDKFKTLYDIKLNINNNRFLFVTQQDYDNLSRV